MQAAGSSDEGLVNWHRQFEPMESEEHQNFLEPLGIEENEIRNIRAL